MAIHIKDADDLKNRLSEAGEKLVVIDFMATWCGPCKMIGPKLEAMATEMADSIVVLKISETESEEPEKLDSNSASESLVIEDVTLLFTTTYTTYAPVTTTTGATTSTDLAQAPIQDLVQEGAIAPTAPSASPPVSTPDVEISTTPKPESKVINIKHAADLTNEVSNAGDKLVVIFVMASWCGFSRQLEPALEDVARSTENILVLKVVYDKVETSEGWKYGVNDEYGYPELHFLKKGLKLDQYVGGDAELLKSKVKENMAIRIE